MKPHSQLPFDGLLLVVSRCPLINHLKSLGGSPGLAPSGGWPDAFVAAPARAADAWVMVVRKAEGKSSLQSGWALGGGVRARPICFGMADPPEESHPQEVTENS